MPVDTISPNLGLTLQEKGNNNQSWGELANRNFEYLEDAITERAAVNTAGGTTTLTADESRAFVLLVTGTLAADATIVVPNRKHVFQVKNATTGNHNVLLQVSGGSSVTITQGTGACVQSDGAGSIDKIFENTDQTDVGITGGSIANTSISNASISGGSVNGTPIGAATKSTGRFTSVTADSVAVGGHAVWHAGNDGSGSGLDADLLDGQQGSAYLRTTGVFNRVNMPAGAKIRTSTGAISQGLEIYQGTTASDAMVTFHVGADFALHFGLSGNLNDLAVGGWSMGGVERRVWHEGNDGAGSGLHADLLDGVHASQLLRADVDDLVYGHTEWQDNKEVRLGNSSDLRLRHNGSDSFVDSYTNHLYIRSLANSSSHGVYIQDEDSGGTLHSCAFFEHDRVLLYYDNSVRLTTVSDGVDIARNLWIGGSGLGDTDINFHDDNSNTERTQRWDDSANFWRFEQNDGGFYPPSLFDTTSASVDTNYPIGQVLLVVSHQTTRNASRTIYHPNGSSSYFTTGYDTASYGNALSGTWRTKGGTNGAGYFLYQRVA